MKLYIAYYYHRHGSDQWPIWVKDGEEAPTEEAVIAGLTNFEPEYEEFVTIDGPHDVPAPDTDKCRAFVEDLVEMYDAPERQAAAFWPWRSGGPADADDAYELGKEIAAWELAQRAKQALK